MDEWYRLTEEETEEYDEYMYFDLLNSYSFTKLDTVQYRIEWKDKYLDSTLSWADVYLDAIRSKFSCVFAYSQYDYTFNVNSAVFKNHILDTFKTNRMEFITPLNRQKEYSPKRTLDHWSQIVQSEIVYENIEPEYGKELLDFMYKEFSQPQPESVVRFKLGNSKLFLRKWSAPWELFPIALDWPTCVQVFMRKIMPIITDIVSVELGLKNEPGLK